MAESGDVIDGRYRLVAELGQGGFGRVWAAYDERLGVDVALKEVWLPPQMPEDERAGRVVRARREARDMVRLRDHPNIVTVYDVVTDDAGMPWMVMRLVDGVSLADRLRTDGPLSPAKTRRMARQLLSALKAAHEAGITHRDIKPGNVLLAEDGNALLTDFGIALDRADTRQTATGTLLGSLMYIAPERLHGEDTPASDLFSLGVTLYEALDGTAPFARDNSGAVVAAVLHDDPPSPGTAAPLEPLLTGLLEKDPARRLSIDAAIRLTRKPAPPARPPEPPKAPPPPKKPTKTAGEPPKGPTKPVVKPPKEPMWVVGLFFLGLLVLFTHFVGNPITILLHRQDARNAHAGDCVVTTKAGKDARYIFCVMDAWTGETKYRVVKRIENLQPPIRTDPCMQAANYDTDYGTYVYWPKDSNGLVLCLMPDS